MKNLFTTLILIIFFSLVCEVYSQIDNPLTPFSKGEYKAQKEPSAISDSPIFPNINSLRDKKDELDDSLNSLNDLSELKSKYADIKKSFNLLAEKTQYRRKSKNLNYAQVMDVRARAWKIKSDLEVTNKDIAKRVEEIINYQNWWLNEEKNLTLLVDSLKVSGKIDSVKPLLREIEEVIESSLALIKKESPSLLQFQADITDMRDRVKNNLDILDDLLKEVRIAFFEQNSPPMVSLQYFRQFNLKSFNQFFQNISKIDFFDYDFLVNYSWFIFFQLFIFIFIIFTITNNRARKFESEFISFVIRRPISVSILVSSLCYLPIYRALPTSWVLIFWFFLSFSIIRVMSIKLKEKWQRNLIILMIGSFLISLFFKMVDLPVYLFRLYILLITITGSFITFRISKPFKKINSSYYNTLRISGFVLFCVALTQFAGFSSLSIHIFESSIKSLLLFLFVYALTFTLKELINFAINQSRVQNITFVKKHNIAIHSKSITFINIVLWAFFGVFLLNIWGIYDTPMQGFKIFTDIGFKIGEQKITIGLVLLVVLIIYFSFFISKTLQNLLSDEIYKRKLIDPNVGTSINRLIHYALIIIGFFSAISILGFELKNFAILGGALGIGIGFGLQNIVNNFVSGLILLLERPVKVGDIIVIGEYSGEVVKVGLRATVVEIFDRSEIIIPNSDLITSKVINWTRVNRSMRIKIPISVAYGSDVSKISNILKNIATKHKNVSKEPAPQVHVTELSDNAIKLELWIWLDDLDHSVSAKTELLETIEKRFREESINIPHQKRDVYIKKEE